MKQPPLPQPPRWAERFLGWFCKPELLEYIQGDLQEAFEDQLATKGSKKARRRYTLEILGLFRLGIIRNFSFSNDIISIAMLTTYFKIAFRQIKKHKLFASLNILGLATSMSVCLLIIMVMVDQYSYDQFHEKKDRIYRVISGYEEQLPQKARFATAPSFLKEEFESKYPWVASTTRMISPDGQLLYGREKIDVDGVWVDQDFLDIFSFGWTEGDRATALKEPFSIVLTQETVDQYFKDKNPMGEMITIPQYGDFVVKGILPEVPRRSHIQFGYLISLSTINSLDKGKESPIKWRDWDTAHRLNHVYLLLKDKTAASEINPALATIANHRNKQEDLYKWFFEGQAVTQISPGNDLSNDSNATPKIVIYFLLTLGLLIILSACFNYTNLSLARAIKRSKEIGIRKVVGAKRGQIIVQFMVESVVISLLSLGLAILFLEFLIQAFYNLDSFVPDHFQLDRTWWIYLIFVGFSIIIGIIAGFLPAWRLSSFKPVQVLKKLTNVKVFSKVVLRKLLLVSQFSLSVIFIITTIIIIKQQQHILGTDIGFDKDNLLNVYLYDTNYDIFKQQLSQISEVTNVSGTRSVPLSGSNMQQPIYLNNRTDSLTINYNYITPNWIDNMGIKLLAGQSFPENEPSKNEKFILVNELASQRFGFSNPKDALGQMVEMDSLFLTVIGVVNNYHYENIWDDPIRPQILRHNPEKIHHANIKISSIDMPTTIRKIRTVWEKLNVEDSMSAHFLDDRIYYRAKFFKMGSKIIGLVGGLAIIIACLGLLGIVTYTVEDKAKEVGIRKVLGASEKNLIWFLSKSFLYLLGFALLIALPLSWLLNNFWLQNFARRIAVSPSILLGVAGMMLLLAMITVVSKTWWAAKANPVGNLRSE